MNKELAARLGPARLPFLLLPPVCVALGYATASRESSSIPALSIILALIGAIASHVSVNSLNEYFDFRSTLDAKTTRTPFSGGSGTLQQRPELASWALWLAIGSALLTAAIGVYFAITIGSGILPLGIGGLLVVVTYSIWSVRNPLLSLITPGLGFGPFMVIGTHFALTGHYSWSAALASLIPFFLVNNLLLLNQFPDVEADRSVGRKNLPIMAGLQTSAIVYASFIFLTYAAIAAGVLSGLLPVLSLIGIATVLLSVPAVIGAFKNNNNIPQLIPAMGLNVVINLVTPLLLAVGIFWG
jgi:1,4-dihydroxy-2-naphthoate polyprenyltransferase